MVFDSVRSQRTGVSAQLTQAWCRACSADSMGLVPHTADHGAAWAEVWVATCPVCVGGGMMTIAQWWHGYLVPIAR